MEIYTRLANIFPGVEKREAQLAYWSSVDKTISGQGNNRLMIEGGCGVGKTVAYLIPLIDEVRRTGKRAVVSTSSKALQAQLLTKDIPLAQKASGSCGVALLQGKSNYVCVERLDRAPITCGLEPALRNAIKAYTDRTDVDGFISDLGTVPNSVKAAISGSNDECGSKDCKEAECFFYKAKQRAVNAQLVVINHHLLIKNAELIQKYGVGILGDFDYLVVDEAHELADTARSCLGFKLSPGKLYALSHEVETKLNARDDARSLMNLGLRFGDLLKILYATGISRVKTPIFHPHAKSFIGDLEAVVVRLETKFSKVDGASSIVDKLRNTFEEAFRFICAKDTDKYVYWLQKDNEIISAECRFLDPKYFLDEMFGERRVILTSATLDTGDSFKFMMNETGLTGAATCKVPSPFDFKTNARLLIPDTITVDPNHEAFSDQAMASLLDVINACRGRVLGLFTSRRMLDAAYIAVKENTAFDVVMQGQDTIANLIKRVKQNPGTVLLGTSSLWTGIDIPGDAVQCVVIDRIPFKSPEDPVHAALCERSSNAFAYVSLPHALMSTRQGAGRLIRSATDRGVLCFLDKRVDTKAYGKTLRNVLPYMPRIHTANEIDVFLANREAITC